MSSRPWKKFFHYFLLFLLIYILVVPAVFFLVDPESVKQTAKNDLRSFILEMAGTATLISFIIAGWLSLDPGLREK